MKGIVFGYAIQSGHDASMWLGRDSWWGGAAQAAVYSFQQAKAIAETYDKAVIVVLVSGGAVPVEPTTPRQAAEGDE